MAPLESSTAHLNADTTSIPSIEDLEAKVARLKRTITDLEAITPAVPNKRLTSTVTLGRGYRRVASMFQDISTLVQEADRREEEEEEEDDEGATTISLEAQRDRDRTFKAFQELVQIIPSFKPNLLNSDGAAVASYFAMLTRGANEARSDDICGLKKHVAEWLNKSPTTMPHLDVDDRSMRGLQHDTTGQLLCPIEYDWDDAEIRTKLRNGEDSYDAFDSFYVRCLYKGSKGDPNDVEKGFLRNYLLIKTFLYIFTSPSSAKNVVDDGENSENTPAKPKISSSKATKSSVAQKLNLHAVTPRSIAYAAVLLHFSLSDAPHWKSMYNGFSYELFYNFIVDFFEDTSGPQANQRIKSLLSWWNKQVFPKRATATAASRASVNKLREQRARREA